MNRITRFPQKNTHAYKIISAIRKLGALTIEDGIKEHGILYETRTKTIRLYETLVDRELINSNKGFYFLTSLTEAKLKQEKKIEVAKQEGNIATPRIINVMNAPPLSKKYWLNPKGTRG